MKHIVMIALALSSSVTGMQGTAPRPTVDSKTPADVQIALAKSAGPAVSDQAAIYILGAHGYVLAHKGTNGFTCLVNREHVDTVEPECYDKAGSDTTLKASFYLEEQRALGVPDDRIVAEIEARYKSGAFKAPPRAGIVYMMSDSNYVWDPTAKAVIHIPGHLMFYAPNLTAADVGTGPGAPYLTHPGFPDNMLVVVPAPSHPH